MLYNNELGKIALAVTQGSAAKLLGLGFGADWIIELSKS